MQSAILFLFVFTKEFHQSIFYLNGVGTTLDLYEKVLLLDSYRRRISILPNFERNKNFKNGLWPVAAVWKQS